MPNEKEEGGNLTEGEAKEGPGKRGSAGAREKRGRKSREIASAGKIGP
jgi:hypothetical protein